MRRSSLLLGVIGLAVIRVPASAMWELEGGETIPVERLIANLTARARGKGASEAEAHYALARVHSMAYALAASSVTVFKPTELLEREKGAAKPSPKEESGVELGAWTKEWCPVFSPHSSVLVIPEGPIDDARLRHFQESAKEYGAAIALLPTDALSHLGLAWLLEDGCHFAPRLGWPDGISQEDQISDDEQESLHKDVRSLSSPIGAERIAAFGVLRAKGPRIMATILERQRSAKEARSEHAYRLAGLLLRSYWLELSYSHYVAAFNQAIENEKDIKKLAGVPDGSIVEEAGEAILRLSAVLPGIDARGKTIESVKGALAVFAKKSRWVTPILFSMDRDASLSRLVPSGRNALFDLDGDGRIEVWPWPAATAAILVWKPLGDSSINSGRQMFGSCTWWMMWRNGYEPMDALDDNGDGRLEGSELSGLCVWTDKNGNAIEDDGEVVDVRSMGIRSIATMPTGVTDGALCNCVGVVLADGTTRTTFDWAPKSVVSGTMVAALGDIEDSKSGSGLVAVGSQDVGCSEESENVRTVGRPIRPAADVSR